MASEGLLFPIPEYLLDGVWQQETQALTVAEEDSEMALQVVADLWPYCFNHIPGPLTLPDFPRLLS